MKGLYRDISWFGVNQYVELGNIALCVNAIVLYEALLWSSGGMKVYCEQMSVWPFLKTLFGAQLRKGLQASKLC